MSTFETVPPMWTPLPDPQELADLPPTPAWVSAAQCLLAFVVPVALVVLAYNGLIQPRTFATWLTASWGVACGLALAARETRAVRYV